MKVRFAARVGRILEDSIAGLPDEDRAARIAYCRETGEHGVRVQVEHGLVRFTWGGRLLAEVEQPVLTDEEAYYRPLSVDMVPAVPDDARELSEE